MTNEEIVLQIQQGHTELYTDLWKKVKYGAYLKARIYKPRNSSSVIEMSDLMQEAFIGMLEAVQTYKADNGYSFTTHMLYSVGHKCAECAHIRTHKHEPLDYAISTVSSDTVKDGSRSEEIGLENLLQDETATEAYNDIEYEIDLQREFAPVYAAMHDLPIDYKKVLEQHFYYDIPYADISKEKGLNPEWAKVIGRRAILKLREILKAQGIEKRLDLFTHFYYHKGVGSFNASGTSEVEDMVEWREKIRERELAAESLKAKREKDIMLIIKALQQIKPDYRVILIRHYFNNETYSDISRKEGQRMDWARSIGQTAVKKIKKSLKNETLESSMKIPELLSAASNIQTVSGYDWQKWLKEYSERKAV